MPLSCLLEACGGHRNRWAYEVVIEAIVSIVHREGWQPCHLLLWRGEPMASVQEIYQRLPVQRIEALCSDIELLQRMTTASRYLDGDGVPELQGIQFSSRSPGTLANARVLLVT